MTRSRRSFPNLLHFRTCVEANLESRGIANKSFSQCLADLEPRGRWLIMSDAVLVRPASLDDLDALTSLFESYRAFYKQVSISLASVSSDKEVSYTDTDKGDAANAAIQGSYDTAIDACIDRLKLGLLEMQSFYSPCRLPINSEQKSTSYSVSRGRILTSMLPRCHPRATSWWASCSSTHCWTPSNWETCGY